MGDENEDVVSKYKRLLSMARSSLEANQASLASKDQQISQLLSALEEERNSKRKSTGKDDETSYSPRKILCRVDVEGLIWVLIEYEEMDDTWKYFGDEESLNDFVQRIPGEPVICPSKCLSEEESFRIVRRSTLLNTTYFEQ
jgi:hypothetical protein